MTEKEIKTTLKSIDNPQFFEDVLDAFYSKEEKRVPSDINDFISSGQDAFSKNFRLFPILDGAAWRNLQTARHLARELINEQGKIDTQKLIRVISTLEAHQYTMGFEEELDNVRRSFVLEQLKKLLLDPELISLIHSIHETASLGSIEIIKKTLQLPIHVKVNHSHVRQAVLCAYLTYLRQNVGSCFATAPAIMIQKEQPHQFLKDIKELLSSGELKRVILGRQYSVPMNLSWGVSDLYKVFLVEESDYGKMAAFPGFILVFETTPLYGKSFSMEQKKTLLEKVFKTTLKKLSLGKPVFLTHPQAIIERVWLDFFELDPADVEKKELSPMEELMHAQVTSHGLQPIVKEGSEKKYQIEEYHKWYHFSLNTFKSLIENSLLKSWEFTLASFSETKLDFTAWNLFTSLGFDPREPQGIGACFYEIIEKSIERLKQEIEELEVRYEGLYTEVKHWENRLNNVSSSEDLKWYQTEYKHRCQEIDYILHIRDLCISKGNKIGSLWSFLLEQYKVIFPEYFQEVYDPEMIDCKSSCFYADRPAGFRLMYKHGRSKTGQWTMIYEPHEYIQSLVEFFNMTEETIASHEHMEDLKEEFSEMITHVMHHLRTSDFLENAFIRMAKQHEGQLVKDPVRHWKHLDKKPWAYTSGGTMSHLVSTYYQLEEEPFQEKKWIENELELASFIIETVRSLPPDTMKIFEKDEDASLLMSSPTHAFLLKPGFPFLLESYHQNQNAFTWVRDRIVIPQKNRLHLVDLSTGMQEHLILEMQKEFPRELKGLLVAVKSDSFSLKPYEFRTKVVSALKPILAKINHPISGEALVDKMLFRALPLISASHLLETLEAIFSGMLYLDEEPKKRILTNIRKQCQYISRYQWITADQLKKICCGLMIYEFEQLVYAKDVYKDLIRSMQSQGFLLHSEFVFADTNWYREYFGFVVNPGTELLELWCCDRYGGNGFPLAEWIPWIRGTKKTTWNIYTHPKEYGQRFI